MKKLIGIQLVIWVSLILVVTFTGKTAFTSNLHRTNSVCDLVSEIPKTECDALVALYNATDGANWFENSGWLITLTPCTWHGITCVDGHVRSINLNENNLTGALPSSWNAFTRLGNLNLSNNHLSGPLPTSVPLVFNQELMSLILSDNQFTGNIPREYAQIGTAFVLDLGNNQITGQIPPEFGNRLFEVLRLSYNQLTGPIPEGLRAYGLYLDNNNLTGPLPDGVTGYLYMDLSNTLLGGPLPQGLIDYGPHSGFFYHNTGLCTPDNQEFYDWLATLQYVQTSGIICNEAIELKQESPVIVSGNLYEGGTVYLEMSIKNYGSQATPPLHLYTEGYTSQNALWRADGAQPTARIIYPGETVTFRVEHDLWYNHVGTWNTYGVFLWNDANNSYYGPLASNGFEQSIEFYVARIAISHIEITQAIQNENNNVLLIENKPTIVRVYVDCGAGCRNVKGITGTLRGYDSLGELPGSPLYPSNQYITAFHQNWTDQRSNYYKSLNFILPKEWTQGSLTLQAEVAGTSANLTRAFQPGKPLRIAWIRIPYYTDSIHNLSLAVERTAASGDSFLSQIFPIAEDDLDYFFQPGLPDFINQPFTDGNIGTYILSLRNFWNRVEQQDSWKGGQAPNRLYGWYPRIAREAGGICGVGDAIWANGEGRVAIGPDYCDKFLPNNRRVEILSSRVFAHEIGHILNSQELRHTPNSITNNDCFAVPEGANNNYPSYPGYPRGSIGQYGIQIENNLQILSPNNTYDFMSYCTNAWVSPYNYAKLFFGFPDPEHLQTLHPIIAERRLLVSGAITTPTLTVAFEPFYAITATVPLTYTNEGDYCFELRGATNELLSERCFDLSYINPETLEPAAQDIFSLVVPYPDGAVQAQLTHLGSTIASLPISPKQPTVTLLSPNGGEIWSANGAYIVTWIAQDLDNNPLSFVIEYSADAGETWWPVATNITQTFFLLDVSRLPGSSEVLLRVSASDGINTGYDSSDTPFTVERKSPYVGIVHPGNGLTMPPEVPVLLQGYAYDLEDGNLDEVSMLWTSSQGGHLGNGRQLLVTLEPGEHTITLTVTDSDNNVAIATSIIFIGQRVYLPTVVRPR